MEIYEEDAPRLTLQELAEELVTMGEIDLGAGERVGDCRLEHGEYFSADIHLTDTGDPRLEGHLARSYEATIQRLREIGVGGTAKYIAFGRDEDGDDVLYTFM